MKEKNVPNSANAEQAGLALAHLLNDLDDDLLLESRQLRPAARHGWYRGLAAMLAVALLFSCSSLAWAVNSLQQENREFYLRYLTPDMLALQGENEAEMDITEQPALFAERGAEAGGRGRFGVGYFVGTVSGRAFVPYGGRQHFLHAF